MINGKNFTKKDKRKIHRDYKKMKRNLKKQGLLDKFYWIKKLK